MNKSQKHKIELRMSDTKGLKLCDYILCREQKKAVQIYAVRRQDSEDLGNREESGKIRCSLGAGNFLFFDPSTMYTSEFFQLYSYYIYSILYGWHASFNSWKKYCCEQGKKSKAWSLRLREFGRKPESFSWEWNMRTLRAAMLRDLPYFPSVA